MLRFFKFTLFCLTILIVEMSFVAAASAYQVTPSQIDNLSWHRATVLSGFVKPKNDLSEEVALYGTNNTPLFVRFWSAAQSRRQLVILIPGTGGVSSSGIANATAEKLARLNYDVIVVACPYSTDFQMSFSQDGIIGFPQKDLKDAAMMIETALQFYRERRGEPHSFTLMGYSLGATYSVLLGNLRLSKKVDKMIAVNPPVRFEHAIQQIDMTIHTILKEDYKPVKLLSRLFDIFRLFNDEVTEQYIDQINRRVPDNEAADLQAIGASFQLSLKNVTKNLLKLGVFSQQSRRISIEDNLNALNFEKYLGLVGISLSQRGYFAGKTFSQVEAEMNLTKILSTHKNLKNVYIFESVDDFLLENDSLQSIEKFVDNRLTVFSAGGHCGDYLSPVFSKKLQEVLSR